METYRYSLRNNEKEKNSFYIILITLLLSIGSFISFISSFNLSYRNIGGGGLREGFLYVCRQIALLAGNKRFIILPLYKLENGEYGLFLTFLLILLIVFSWLSVKSRNRFIILIYIVPIIINGIILGIVPSIEGFLILISGIILFQFYSFKEYDMNMVLPLILLIVLIPLGTFLNSKTAKSINTFKTCNIMDEVVGNVRYGKKEIKNDETAFFITMDNPQEMWLCGYKGERDTGKGWAPDTDRNHYAYIEKGNRIRKEGLNPLNQLSEASKIAELNKQNGKVSIEMKNGRREHLLIPYELSGKVNGKYKNYGDSFLKGKGFRGACKYEYNATNNLTGDWTSLTGTLFKKENSDGARYRKAEEFINSNVYERYTGLSEASLISLYSYFGSSVDLNKGHEDYRKVIKKVTEFTEKEMIFRHENEGAVTPENIMKTRAGNDKAYASIATAIFRYYGIPSRYVEGYQVKTEDVNRMKPNKPYGIRGKNGHAWCEIYIDGTGWVPFEATPEYRSNLKQPDYEKGLENNNLLRIPDNKKGKRNFERKSNVKIEGENGGKVNVKKILFFILLFILVSAFILIILKRLVIYIRKQRSFKQKDIRKAVCAIYAEILKKSPNPPKNIKEIGEKAAYSLKPVKEKDREKLIMWLKSLKRGGV